MLGFGRTWFTALTRSRVKITSTIVGSIPVTFPESGEVQSGCYTKSVKTQLEVSEGV